MRYRQLGNTGYKVSEIGLGCEHIDYRPYEVVKETIDKAIAGGMNIMDVFMAGPDVRSYIGRALEGRRDKVMLQGHIGSTWQNGQYTVSRDIKICREAFGDFMERTKSDCVEIAMVHFSDSVENLAEAVDNGLFDFARELKASGKAKLIGLSSHIPGVAAKAVELGLIDVLMFSINPAFDFLDSNTVVDDMFKDESYVSARTSINPERKRLYSLCEAKGVGITVMKTLAAGRLLDAKSSPFGKAMTVSQCAHYALTRPGVASVLIGASEPWHVDPMLAYETATNEERDYSSVIANGTVFRTAGRCMYCNHCLPCPSEIDVASVTKYLDLQTQTGSAMPNTVSAHYDALSAHASDCIECGACESRCPFAVPVRENMRRAKELFGK